MEGGKEANYWPGFVDALSNVVVTMVFVMVVFVIALLYFSQNKAKEAIEAYKKEAEEKASREPKADPTLQQALEDLKSENEALKKSLASARASAAAATTAAAAAQQKAANLANQPQAGNVAKSEVQVAEADTKAGPSPAVARISGSQSSIEISYPLRTYELDKNSSAALEARFAEIASRAKSEGIELVAVAEVLPYSEGRRVAYYRNMTLRNWLIDHGVPAAKIRVRIAETNTGRTSGLVQLSLPGAS